MSRVPDLGPICRRASTLPEVGDSEPSPKATFLAEYSAYPYRPTATPIVLRVVRVTDAELTDHAAGTFAYYRPTMPEASGLA